MVITSSDSHTCQKTCSGFQDPIGGFFLICFAAALCLLSGIECRVISGTSTFGFGEGAHAWCQVRIGYIWYHIDVTWDDPIPDVENLVRYDFYLKGDMMMKATHG